jgi:epoxyqueuosine reductase QueG
MGIVLDGLTDPDVVPWRCTYFAENYEYRWFIDTIMTSSPVTNGPTGGIEDKIREIASSGGAFKVGFADIRPLNELVVGDPTTFDYPSAISFAVEIPAAAALSAMKAPSEEMREAYKQCNKKLKQMGMQMVEALNTAGRKARFVDPSERVDPERLLGPISHKAIARLSGLGWIGKNGLLMTEEYGPRFRMGTVLTDLPIASNPQPLEDDCGDCTLCIEKCPTSSLKGLADLRGRSIERDAVIDWVKCGKYEKALIGDGSRPEKACGRCIAVCPRSGLDQ